MNPFKVGDVVRYRSEPPVVHEHPEHTWNATNAGITAQVTCILGDPDFIAVETLDGVDKFLIWWHFNAELVQL